MRERQARVTRGTLRVRKHCVFRWWRAEQWWTDEAAPRTVEIETHHCEDCVAAVQKIARAERRDTVLSWAGAGAAFTDSAAATLS